VICTEGVGAAAIVRRIDAGLVVERSSGAIAGALAALLADRGRRARFGERAREIMAQEYTWDAIARDMEGVYVAAHGVAASGRRAA
jgi:glycosyltransferase involved in cell wall biosynthesis